MKQTRIDRLITLMRRPDARLVCMHEPEQAYYIVPGGYRVQPAEALKLQSHPLVCGGKDGLFPGHDQTWRLGS